MEYLYTNMDYLKELSDDNHEFMIDMISTFLDQTPQFIQDIKAAYKAGNFEEVKKIAHKMKPTFPMMGILNYTDDILLLEKIGMQASPDSNFDIILNKVSDMLEVAYIELEEQLKTMS